MRNYIHFGPFRLRMSSKNLAPWGFARFGIAGLSFFSRTSGGDLTLADYHPRSSTTWHWAASIVRSDQRELANRSPRRSGQWHDYYRLPFGRVLRVSRQDWHKQRRAAA